MGADDSKLYAIWPGGAQSWVFTTEGAIRSSPALATDGTIYVGACDRRFKFIYPNGVLKWFYTAASGDFTSSPALGADGTIYVASGDGKLYAFSPGMTLKWSFPGAGGSSSPALGTDGTIYVGASNGHLFAVRPDGTEKWRTMLTHELGGVMGSPTVGADGIVYVGAGTTLCAVNADGGLRWVFRTGGYPQASSVLKGDGTLYVGSDDGVLYALRTSSRGLARSSWPTFHHDLRRTGRQAMPSTTGLFLLLE